MKKTIFIFLAASLLLTGCNGGDSSGMSEQLSDVKVTTAAITEEKNDTTNTTEGITSEIVTETNEKPSESSEPETVPITTEKQQQETVTENAGPTEEAVTAPDSGVKVNADGSIDLPIIPVD
jgi:predicted small secreted protein